MSLIRQFQSTHPSWGATQIVNTSPSSCKISIHAPIVGCDEKGIRTTRSCYDFNPRTHRGVRPKKSCFFYKKALFQSTHPSWGATKMPGVEGFYCRISIHAPIVGCDQFINNILLYIIVFQSTHPSWGATDLNYDIYLMLAISIHAPIVGCDLEKLDLDRRLEISIHAPIVGCDKLRELPLQLFSLFQSTHPSWGATRAFSSLLSARVDFNPRTHRGVRLFFF